MKKPSLYSISILAVVIFLSVVLVPTLFHDFRLTVERVDYLSDDERHFVTNRYDDKIIKEFGIENLFNQASTSYEQNNENGQKCNDESLSYNILCQVETTIKAYKAYSIIEKLQFEKRGEGFYSSAIENNGKLYFVHLSSINLLDYLIVGILTSIIALFISIWVVMRKEKQLTRLQNHTIGLVFATFTVMIMLLSILRSSNEPLILYPPFAFLFGVFPFVGTYALWYLLISKIWVRKKS